MKKQVSILLALTALALSCKQPIAVKAEPCFYFFKTSFALNQLEQSTLQQQKVKQLYLKYFDVVWDSLAQEPRPIAKLLADSNKLNYISCNVVPTVFITNNVFNHTTGIEKLADDCTRLIEATSQVYGIGFNEVQIDCDWTSRTAKSYFDFLTKVKALLPNKLITATLRLHQVKFVEASGVPPVERMTLMCYNMGNLTQFNSKNSIIDAAVFKQYTARLSAYPLPLDIALPIFGWYVHFRGEQYVGLIRQLPDSVLKLNFIEKSANTFMAKNNFYWQQVLFKKADVLRREESSLKEINAVANLLKQQLTSQPRRIVLYHLDSVTLNKFSADEIKSIFSSLN
jgi:hypothetical protein